MNISSRLQRNNITNHNNQYSIKVLSFMKLKNSFYIVITFSIIILFTLAFTSLETSQISLNQKAKVSKDTVWIFNGKNLSNLKLILDKDNIKADNIYSIKDNSIFFNKGYKGYIRTKEKYSGFNLHAEWKWTKKNEKGNSGILVFIQSTDTIWPNCIQINFKEQHAGDLIAMNGAEFYEAVGKSKNTEVIHSSSSENPEGEWNSCDIFCHADSMIVYINSVLQNRATKIVNHDGYVGWQLEGKPIALRNLFLVIEK